MKRLWLILFALPLIAQNQWGNTEVQDPCNNQEYLILKKRVETKGANDLMPIKNGVIDFEKYEYYRHYDKLCLEYKKNPCGYIDYQNLKKKGVVNLTASEFETYKIFDSACMKQESARRRGAEYQYIEGNEWTGGKYQKSNPAPTVPQEPVQTETKKDNNFPVEVLQELLNIYQSESDYSSPSMSFGTGGNKGCNIYGKIKFVEFGEDYKVRFVDYGESLKVKYVEYGEYSKGNWKMVVMSLIFCTFKKGVTVFS
ncbi:MAG: hypothetical protein HOC18_03180 [Candidatus Marinimicrobia bacterium]|jgi:hypothetical protein|nr:hypothetical protein [Candidatus Neomarinimicrobiota bacterium]